VNRPRLMRWRCWRPNRTSTSSHLGIATYFKITVYVKRSGGSPAVRDGRTTVRHPARGYCTNLARKIYFGIIAETLDDASTLYTIRVSLKVSDTNSLLRQELIRSAIALHLGPAN
jgi:hypothetical protein